jgi:hypothetical protein
MTHVRADPINPMGSRSRDSDLFDIQIADHADSPDEPSSFCIKSPNDRQCGFWWSQLPIMFQGNRIVLRNVRFYDNTCKKLGEFRMQSNKLTIENWQVLRSDGGGEHQAQPTTVVLFILDDAKTQIAGNGADGARAYLSIGTYAGSYLAGRMRCDTCTSAIAQTMTDVGDVVRGQCCRMAITCQ